MDEDDFNPEEITDEFDSDLDSMCLDL